MVHALERLYRRRLPPDAAVTHELCTELARLSHAAGVQIGVLIDRGGAVEYVIAGDASSLSIPPLDRRRSHHGRLQGLRLIHTHFGDTGLSSEDLTDLARLRLDLIYAVTVLEGGEPGLAHGAHLTPDGPDTLVWKLLDPIPTYRVEIPFERFISDLEDSIGRMHRAKAVSAGDRAILVATGQPGNAAIEINLAELRSLAQSAGIAVLDTVIQRRPQPDPRYVLGKGKLQEIYIKALAMDANLIVFDHELSPSQARSISDLVDMRVIDRTQVILDIFAKRARTMEGKIQVELAQLKYNMPRLVGKNPALSRLAGGIGTKGPGETKLEIDRRRAKERMARLEKETRRISAKRALTRRRRSSRHIPVISIIGYTNTGKSTLLNTLTKSRVLAADMPFATLDPSSKRLRFPREIEVIITDTVGFIRDLPDDLKAAFMATLEELSDADLLLEVIDVSDPHIDYRMQAVDDILAILGLKDKHRLRVFNKADRCEKELALTLTARYHGVLVSALDRATLSPLIERLEQFFIDQAGQR
ncbi:MAG: GTPase HflX [Syntrophaceae bacterium]